MKILRPKVMAQKCGVAPITIHRWANDPKYAHLNFPKPISLGEHTIGYSDEEAEDWLSARSAERDESDAAEDVERPP